ncbi:unnamed protein product [Rotaria sordida]|uniref:NAD(P)(+)--arginine ADP-ribosyltransferase n=2 Tax=Rotaria sordida TaxID=392033 RepID=A0A814S1Q7_9BILA|nr:unnamed protein product [Rotaria sordida]CAF1142001.1 unnamed protein product [Rotaria sordida]
MATFPYSTSNDSSKNGVWFWNSNLNPWLTPVPVEQRYSSGTGNFVVEETYKRYKPQAVAVNDNIIVDSKYQMPNSDHHKKRAIKEIEHKSKDKHLREERFMGLPISSESSFGGHFGSASPFFIEIKKYLNLEQNDLSSETSEMIPMFVEKVAQGIIEEGKQIGKERKAEKMATMLREKKHEGMEEVWEECVYLYTSKNFLYKALNATMKLVGGKDQENIWRSKVPTLGPFCLLLLNKPFNKELTKNKTIYRSANVTPEQIVQYEEMAKNKSSYQSFKVYTSCTRNLKNAKALGNTLFIMAVLDGFIMDISPYSKYPEEEEELITPGVCFRVQSVTFNQKKNRYLINLELRQKLTEEDKSDASAAEKLKKYFVQRRLRFYHPRQNEDINTIIANGIENAAVVLVFPSPSLQVSNVGSKLLNYADQTKTPILTIKICEDFQPVNWLGAILAPTKSCSTDFDEVMQTLISMGIKTSDFVLERGEKNEPQPIEEYLFKGETKSGNLKAKYQQSGKEYPIEFRFLGLKHGKVFGQGDDKDGAFTLAGEYKLEDGFGVIKMQKQYVGKDSVKYRGKISVEALNCVIEGQWKIGKMHDKFSMHLILSRPYTTDIEKVPPPQISRKQGSKVMISYCPCQYDLAQKITKGLIAKGIPAVCPPIRLHDMIKIAAHKARVVVPLMSKAYEASNTAKYVLSYADEADIPIVPVKAQDPYSQSGWLGVICAGALWVQMTNANEFEKKLDELITHLQPYVNDFGDEEQEMDFLVDETLVEGYYMQSGEQLPLQFDMFTMVNGYIAGEGEDEVGIFVINGSYNCLPDTEELEFEFEKHYVEKYDVQYSGTITEEESILFFDGKWFLDNISDSFHLEVPLNEPSESESLHIMLSYQWNSQELVKKVANKLKENDIPIWFDIAGDMKGNINSAMANGVEGSAMIISFNTLAYSKSVNCQKEFTYAMQLEKNIVPVLLENEKNFQDTWLGNAIASVDKVNMENESLFDSSFDVLLQRIKKALEEKVDEDSNQSEVITRFEGGAVHGKYYRFDQSFDMVFDFFSLIEGRVSGQGIDNVAAFTMAGDYDNEGNISFKKQYVGKNAIEHKGTLDCDELGGFKINGTWSAGSSTGDFYVESIDDSEDDTMTHDS